MEDLLELAEQHATQDNKQVAIFICFATIEEMISALEYTDDSSGYVYGFVEQAFEILGTIIDRDNKCEAQQIFEMCLEKIAARVGAGFDGLNSFISLACDAIYDKKQFELLQPYLVPLGTNNSKYDDEFLAKVKLDLLARFESEAKTEAFLLSNLQYPFFRKNVINRAIHRKEYALAKTYALAGINADKEYAGLINDWKNDLLHIAELENDKSAIVETALFLFHNQHFNFKYYKKVKKHSLDSEWKIIVDNILIKLHVTRLWKPFDTIAKIHVEEQQWNLLLETISECSTFDLLAKYETVLNEKFHKELIGLYEKSIRNYLENNVDRKHYEVACVAIRRLKKLLPDQNVNYLINELRAKYKNRRALLELLTKI